MHAYVPLEAAELERLAGLARGGDIAARNRIVEAYWLYVFRVVRRLRATRPGRWSAAATEDLVQEGCIGLMRAARTWDPARNATFLGHATLCIRQTIIDSMRRTRRLVEPLDPATLEIEAEPDEAPILRAREDVVHEALSCLDPFDRELMVRRYGIGTARPHRGRDIGEWLGFTKQAASRHLRRAEGQLARIIGRLEAE